MNHILRYLIVLFVVTTTLASFNSCNKFEGEQTIPAYLQIDTITLTTDYFVEGENTHNITDAWVYVNNDLVGCFELPATFPVLARGKNKLEIRAGIKLNGIGNTRVPYSFYESYIVEDFEFFEDSIIKISPSVSYYETDLIEFAWLEDFEGSSISLEATSNSDTIIRQTSPANNPEALISEYSAYSGEITLDKDHDVFVLASFMAYELPALGVPSLLEINYKCTEPFGVGMFGIYSNQIVDIPLVGVNKTDVWKKIYINLGPNVQDYNDATNFKIYFEGSLGDATTAKFYFDNIKLIYRKTS